MSAQLHPVKCNSVLRRRDKLGVVNGWIAKIAGRYFGMGPTTQGQVTETRDVPMHI
ncbi:MAG TPA: hypothetical protein VEG44_09625 [Candidatus Acidoferrales bacterium]|nr:hypothetical protein [Candidatus Acidoferrales bacterium]